MQAKNGPMRGRGEPGVAARARPQYRWQDVSSRREAPPEQRSRDGDPGALPAVWSCTEWDPLEEVVVGVVDGAAVPPWHAALRATMPREAWPFFQRRGGAPFPAELVDAARRELDAFARLLESEGVTVRRPDRAAPHARPYATPDWSSAGGLYAAMPRDVLLVVGDELIEAPMAWRSRHFEIHAYRSLLKEYFRRGARWTAAPRPRLADALYDSEYEEPEEGGPMRYLLTEEEPVFDAADFVRCGRDLFYQRSNVTNRLGVEWLARHLGPGFRLHEVTVHDTHPMHIDATLLPLAPGKVLVNPERVRAVPEPLRRWDVLRAPPPVSPGGEGLFMSSAWVSMNVLMLDERRVVVERREEPLRRALAGWGFEPIPCSFAAFNRFGGSFHCATLDVRRRGELKSHL